MSLVILTTDTLHHARFIQQVSARFPITRVFEETTSVSAPFETSHPFENLQDEYEQDIWFSGQNSSIVDFTPVNRFENLNSPKAISELADLSASVVIVFGTRRLKPAMIEAAGSNIFNLHGGNPENYRGLDTHLWAIYHEDFSNLFTTLHTVNEVLDDGRIVASLPVPILPGMELHQMRAANTEVCIQLTLTAIQKFMKIDMFPSRPQKTIGRYYSFMPTSLKELCLSKFQRHTAKLR